MNSRAALAVLLTLVCRHRGAHGQLHAPLSEETTCGVRGNQSLCHLWWNSPSHHAALNPASLQGRTQDSALRDIMAWRMAALLADPIGDAAAAPPHPRPHAGLPPCRSGGAGAGGQVPDDYLGTWLEHARYTGAGEASRCFLPSSRAYLLSFFGAALEADPDDEARLASGALRPGDKATLRIRACAAAPSPRAVWRDVWSRRVPTLEAPLDLGPLCPHFDLSARLVEDRHDAAQPGWGADSIRPATVQRTGSGGGGGGAGGVDAKSACTWEAFFTVPAPAIAGPAAGGSFRVEVSHVWQHGGYGAGSHDLVLANRNAHLMDRLRCDAAAGFAWRGHTAATILGEKAAHTCGRQ